MKELEIGERIMEMKYVSYAAESILLTERFLRHFVKVVIVRR